MTLLRNVDGPRAALLLVDIQHDFLPGGALAVRDGDAILAPVRALMSANLFGVVVATQDWHPAHHISFASEHEGYEPFDSIELYGHEQRLWPDHCVQGSPGAELHPHLPWDRADAFLRKGIERDSDSYSGFRNNWEPNGDRPSTGLSGYLRDRGVRDVYIAGLARDVCVRWTAVDAAEAGFNTAVLWDLTRSVDPDRDEAMGAELVDHRVTVLESALLTER